MKKSEKGRFITFEGIDGAGKSTHISYVSDFLSKAGIKNIVTREPGGTALGEKLRDILLHQNMRVATEALLMFAARQEHLEQVILPALNNGTWVISDRFSDASFAYQGYGKGLSLKKLEQLENWVQEDFQPDLTLLFDLPPKIAEERRINSHEMDRFEQEKEDFFKRVQTGYLERAKDHLYRFHIIDGSRRIDEIQSQIASIIKKMISLD